MRPKYETEIGIDCSPPGGNEMKAIDKRLDETGDK